MTDGLSSHYARMFNEVRVKNAELTQLVEDQKKEIERLTLLLAKDDKGKKALKALK